MIKNEHQYKVTKKLALELEDALSKLGHDRRFRALHPKAQKAHLSSLNAQLSQHLDELREYEALQAGKFDFEKLPSIEQIPAWLIQARIARGLRQEDLAKLLNLKKQQVQQYEATDYAAASLNRLNHVLAALRAYNPAALESQGLERHQR